MQTLSIVIANYNYAQYVAASIQSALDVEWNDLDVVVVDDGSTDDSQDVIRRFDSSVRTVFTKNQGQREAVNTGFALCRGDVIIFLDADDILPTNVATEIQRHWRPGVSKWQFRMQPIDETDRVMGSAFPDLDPVPSPEKMRRWLVDTSAYPTPPGSGNAYARGFLEMILPVDASVGSAADSALLVAAPLGGDVIVVPSVCVSYRRHASNDSNVLADPATRFQREVTRAHQRWDFVLGFAERYDVAPRPAPEALRRSRELVQFRTVAWRMSLLVGRESPERLGSLVWDLLRSPSAAGPESWLKRMLIVAFGLAVLAAPQAWLNRLLARRFAAAR